MTAIRSRKRRKKPTKRFPQALLRGMLQQDRRLWTALGVVIDPEGVGEHYELVIENGVLVDILIEVETVPQRIHLTGCRLATAAAGAGQGIWTIPNVGDEVAVLVPDGQIDFSPMVVAILSSGDVPNPSGQGPAPNRTIIVNGEVLVHDGSGGAEALVKKSEFDGHTHGSGTYQAGGDDVTGTSSGAASVTGTTILKAK